MKKLFPFFLTLCLGNALLIHAFKSEYFTTLCAQSITQRHSSIIRMPPSAQALDLKRFVEYPPEPPKGFGYKIDNFKAITFYYNQPPATPGPKRKLSIDSEIIKHTAPLESTYFFRKTAPCRAHYHL